MYLVVRKECMYICRGGRHCRKKECLMLGIIVVLRRVELNSPVGIIRSVAYKIIQAEASGRGRVSRSTRKECRSVADSQAVRSKRVWKECVVHGVLVQKQCRQNRKSKIKNQKMRLKRKKIKCSHHMARPLPLTSCSGTRGAWVRGEGGWGPDETEAVWRWRKCTGELLEGMGDSGRGSMPSASG